MTAQWSKPIRAHTRSAINVSSTSSGSPALTAREISPTAVIHGPTDVETSTVLTRPSHHGWAGKASTSLVAAARSVRASLCLQT